MLNTEQIEKIALLARLDLNEEEKKKYADQLSAIFDFVKTLDEVDVEGVAETCQVTGLENVMREDVVEACSEETRQKLIKSFPDKSGDLLKVKQVFDN